MRYPGYDVCVQAGWLHGLATCSWDRYGMDLFTWLLSPPSHITSHFFSSRALTRSQSSPQSSRHLHIPSQQSHPGLLKRSFPPSSLLRRKERTRGLGDQAPSGGSTFLQSPSSPPLFSAVCLHPHQHDTTTSSSTTARRFGIELQTSRPASVSSNSTSNRDTEHIMGSDTWNEAPTGEAHPTPSHLD